MYILPFQLCSVHFYLFFYNDYYCTVHPPLQSYCIHCYTGYLYFQCTYYTARFLLLYCSIHFLIQTAAAGQFEYLGLANCSLSTLERYTVSRDLDLLYICIFHQSTTFLSLLPKQKINFLYICFVHFYLPILADNLQRLSQVTLFCPGQRRV